MRRAYHSKGTSFGLTQKESATTEVAPQPPLPPKEHADPARVPPPGDPFSSPNINGWPMQHIYTASLE
jgi:hypothetical protein